MCIRKNGEWDQMLILAMLALGIAAGWVAQLLLRGGGRRSMAPRVRDRHRRLVRRGARGESGRGRRFRDPSEWPDRVDPRCRHRARARPGPPQGWSLLEVAGDARRASCAEIRGIRSTRRRRRTKRLPRADPPRTRGRDLGAGGHRQASRRGPSRGPARAPCERATGVSGVRARPEAGRGPAGGRIAYRLFLWLLPTALFAVGVVGLLADLSSESPERVAHNAGFGAAIALTVAQATQQSEKGSSPSCCSGGSSRCGPVDPL